MTKPKTLEQLRTEKERAETQLAQEQHKEIGKQYGRTRSTTGRRIQIILQQLRAELEGIHHEPATPL